MKRRVSPDAGFWMCIFLNLVFHGEWLLLAVVMLAGHYWLGLPLFLFWLCLIIWCVWALVITLFAQWVSRTSVVPTTPGSKRASERIRAYTHDDRE